MKENMNRALRSLAGLALLVTVVGAAPAPAEDQAVNSAQGTGKGSVSQEPSRGIAARPAARPVVVSPNPAAPGAGRQEPETAATESLTSSSSREPLAQPGCTICMSGNASTTWTGNSGSFHVDTISNNRSTGSGPLDLRMALSVASPVFGQTVNYFSLSDFVTLNPLSAGFHYSNVNSGTVSFLGNTIPVGEYFLLMFLREYVTGTYFYTDFIVFNQKVSCNGAVCSIVQPPAGCTEDAYTMCLVGGRYKVTSNWKNQYAGGATANLNKARLTDVTGAFWIANASTFEYMIRVNTATDNGRAWMTILTFTSVEFWVQVTDTRTGQFKEYHSTPGNVTLIYDPSFFVYP
ncbi:MAG: hypothetical protein NEA02_07135 [Thermoanaerobaculia bacterium]|nr:hypothetical protein [Thermoanaerobaculia bacterium]